MGMQQKNTNVLENPYSGKMLTVSKLAKLLRKDLSGTSTNINRLIQKGVIFEKANQFELRECHRPVSERPLFVNPEIAYLGDLNQIDAALCKLL